MQPEGEALINYLRHGRPKADVREIFVRTRAPYHPLSRTGIYNVVRRRTEAAGVNPSGKRGPHMFRHYLPFRIMSGSRRAFTDLDRNSSRVVQAPGDRP